MGWMAAFRKGEDDKKAKKRDIGLQFNGGILMMAINGNIMLTA
jgi:hypothetical protein